MPCEVTQKRIYLNEYYDGKTLLQANEPMRKSPVAPRTPGEPRAPAGPLSPAITQTLFNN